MDVDAVLDSGSEGRSRGTILFNHCSSKRWVLAFLYIIQIILTGIIQSWSPVFLFRAHKPNGLISFWSVNIHCSQMKPGGEQKTEDHNAKQKRSVMMRRKMGMKMRHQRKEDGRRRQEHAMRTRRTMKKTTAAWRAKAPKPPGGKLRRRTAMRKVRMTNGREKGEARQRPNRRKKSRIRKRRETLKEKIKWRIKVEKRTRKRRMGSWAGAVFSESFLSPTVPTSDTHLWAYTQGDITTADNYLSSPKYGIIIEYVVDFWCRTTAITFTQLSNQMWSFNVMFC